MTIVAIGRAFDGLDVDINSAQWSGSQLSLSGDLYLGAVTAANRKGTAAAVRERLTALVDRRDEAAVPVTWTEDSTVIGWFAVTGASVDYSAASLNDGYATWTADLQRVGDSTLPSLEAVTSYGAITGGPTDATLNAAGDANGAICGVPAAAVDVDSGDSTRRGKAVVSRASDSGSVRVLWGDLIDNLPGTLYHYFAVDAGDAYDGACQIKGTWAGIADTLCLGRSMEPAIDTNFQLSNGIIRARFNASGVLIIQVYDTNAWVTVGPATWGITGTIGGSSFTWSASATSAITVLANRPEIAAVRIVGDEVTIGGTRRGRVWVTLTVKRGSRIVEVNIDAEFDATWAIAPSSNSAATNLTNYARQTSNDANGNRWVVATTGSPSINTTTGAVTGGSSVSAQIWGIGSEVDGTSATTPNTAQCVAYELFAGRAESVRVVLR